MLSVESGDDLAAIQVGKAYDLHLGEAEFLLNTWRYDLTVGS
jgi:hypothetical protein